MKATAPSPFAANEPRALRIPEFLERFAISNATFWRYQRLGTIRTIRIGGRVLVPPSEVLRIDQEGIPEISRLEEKRRLAEMSAAG